MYCCIAAKRRYGPQEPTSDIHNATARCPGATQTSCSNTFIKSVVSTACTGRHASGWPRRPASTVQSFTGMTLKRRPRESTTLKSRPCKSPTSRERLRLHKAAKTSNYPTPCVFLRPVLKCIQIFDAGMVITVGALELTNRRREG